MATVRAVERAGRTRGRRAVVAALLAVVVLAGCGASGGSDAAPSSTTRSSTTTTRPTTTASPTTSSPRSTSSTTTPPTGACPTGGRTGVVERSVQVAGEQRSYLVYVPEGLSGPAPLVVTVHGLGSNAVEQLAYSGFSALADRDGFLVASPQARGFPTMWNFLQPASEPTSDAAFLKAMDDDIAATWCVDPARRYVSGISNGSAVTFALACAGSFGFAAYGGVAGALYGPPCADAPPAPIIYFHGSDDPVVPIDGGQALRTVVKPVADTMAAWADHNGCGGPEVQDVSANVTRTTWSGCDDDATVDYYRVEGGGHTWPGAIDVPRLGPTTHEIMASELMWAFFQAHPAS